MNRRQGIFISVALCYSIIPFLTRGLMAQAVNCMEQYAAAVEYFDKGRIDSTYRILISCINEPQRMNSISKSDRGKIYRLAAETSFYLGYHDEAELFAQEFREINPFYEIQGEDLPQFAEYVENTRLIPKNTIGFKTLYSHCKPSIIKNLSPYYPEGYFYEYFTFFQFGLQFKRFISSRIAIGAELLEGLFLDMTFTGSYIPGKDQAPSQFIKFSTLEWPIYMDYFFYRSKRFVSYGELGMSLIIPINSAFTFGDYFIKKQSDQFGKYYSVVPLAPDWDPDYPNGNHLSAFFFESPLQYNFILGIGATINLSMISLGINARYFPKLIKNDPFKEIYDFWDIPETEDLYYYDDIYLMGIKNHFQFSFTFGINIGYRTL